jgi:hypothetical protein
MPAVIAALVALAEGALQYLGGQAMKSIMGNPDLQNIERLVRSAISEINAATRIAIDENEIRQLIQSMEAVFSNLRDYAELQNRKDQRDNEFLLTDAILKTNDAAFQCVSLKIPAILCFANAVSLNLLARAAFYKLHSTPESKLLIGRMAEQSALTATGLVDPFIASLDPSVRLGIPSPECECIDNSPPEFPPSDFYLTCTCWVLVDGNRVQVRSGSGGVSDAEYNGLVETQRKQLSDFRDAAVTNIKSPVCKAIDAWRTANQTAITMELDLLPEAARALSFVTVKPSGQKPS